MRFSVPTIATVIVAVISSVTAQSPCTTNFVGTPEQLQAAQQQAIADFGNLFLVQKNIQRGFDLFIPGEYINHNPYATSGRQNALNILVPALASSSLTFTNVHAFSGQGYGLLHYRMRNGGSSTAVMDKFRFVGTCIVEHWDVGQSISGRESNPIAFF
ncbi:hypothetical protein H1R20_g13284, partial [Candolleomyces eurysporus]